MEGLKVKKYFLIISLVISVLLTGCSSESANTEQLEQQIKELKIENGQLKTENAKLKERVDLMKKQAVEKDKK